MPVRSAPLVLAVLVTTDLVSAVRAAEPPGRALDLARSHDGLPVVAVTLGGETLRFGLDTGSSRAMIAAGVAERLGLVARARFPVATAAGPVREALCAGPVAVELGGVELVLDCLGWVPGERRLAGAPDLDGLLGGDALGTIDLWIDLAAGAARVAPAGDLGAWVAGERLAVERIEGRPAIAVTAAALGGAGDPARLVVDSGSDAVLIFGELARRAARHPGLPRATARLTTAAGGVETTAADLGRARTGGRRLDLGWAPLLPQVVDRAEDGLLPLGKLGPTLFALAAGEVVVGARFSSAPQRVRSSTAASVPK